MTIKRAEIKRRIRLNEELSVIAAELDVSFDAVHQIALETRVLDWLYTEVPITRAADIAATMGLPTLTVTRIIRGSKRCS